MAGVLVIHASQDKQFAESFITAAQTYEPKLTFDRRDHGELSTLDADALARYGMVVALLSPELLISPSALRLFAGSGSRAATLLIAATIRQASIPPDMGGWRYINAEHLSPQQLAAMIFAPMLSQPGETRAGQFPAPPASERVEAPPVPAEAHDWDILEEERAADVPPESPAPPAPAAPPAAPPPPPTLGAVPPPAPGAVPPPAPGAVPPPAPQAAPPPAPRRVPGPDITGVHQVVPPATRGGLLPATETLRFSAYHPNTTPVVAPQTLLIYTHLPAQLAQVQQDAGTFTELGSAPVVAQGQSSRKIARNVEMTIEPHMEGVTFSPAQDSFIWRGEWHRSLFRYSGAQYLAGTVQRGWIDIYAGRVSPICTIDVSFSFHASTPAVALSVPHGIAVTGNAFDTVFISYSHRDREAMRQAREAYEQLGIIAYHDDLLEAGANYERRLAEMIRSANIFHLLWSGASARSPEVRKEWLLALQAADKGERFIRPWYWQQPLVSPPPEFHARKISFRYEHLRRRLLIPSTWL